MINWIKLDKIDHQILQYTRSTLHLATQLVSAAPRSFLPFAENDDNGWLAWNAKQFRLESKYFGPKLNVQAAIDFSDFKLQLLVEEMVFEEIELYKKSFQDIEKWIKNAFFKLKLDYNQYHLELPYKLDQSFPPKEDYVFDYYDPVSFKEFSKLYHNAQSVLKKARTEIIGKKISVKVWPHHFDMAILHNQTPENSIGIGLSPGDNYYNQPYFYISPYPYPMDEELNNTNPIVGKWHTKDFKALVLKYDEIFKETAELESQLVYDFLKNGIAISGKLLSY